MAGELILVVDDEPDILELVRYNLNKEGYRVQTAATGEHALRYARESKPALVVLDLMLPGIDGMSVCRRLKDDEATKHIPIIMLTAKTGEHDVVKGLETGADDYVTKPFSPKVLTARVGAHLRRRNDGGNAATPSVIRIHDITIDTTRHEVFCGETAVDLSATEFAILEFLARNPGWVFSRAKIIDAVRGKDYPVTDRAVDVQILGLRKRLGRCAQVIQTVRGVGYRMEAQ